MKRLLLSFLAVFAIAFSQAQTFVSSTLATNTPVALITAPTTLLSLQLTATTANSTTFKFYDFDDATASKTNVVYAATVRYVDYATNYTVQITNTAGIVLTNTFVGNYKEAQVVSAVTNERPRTLTITVPASSSRTITLSKRLRNGLVAQANYAGLVEVEHETNQ